MAKKQQSKQELKEALARQVRVESTLKDADHTLIHIEDPHYKFYQLSWAGNIVQTCYGRIGTSGNHSVKTLRDSDLARQHVEHTLREKFNKGYEEPLLANAFTSAAAPKRSKKLTAEGLDKLDAFLSTLK